MADSSSLHAKWLLDLGEVTGGDSTISITFRVEIVPGTPIEGDVSIRFCDALPTTQPLRGEA